jgi:hypothetical protein
MFAAALNAGRSFKTCASSNPTLGGPDTTLGLPSVNVPVLSMTSVSIFPFAQRFGILINTPACAPRPTPTMIDIGVARLMRRGRR